MTASAESDVPVDTLTASVSMIIVILSVLALEKMFHLLHFITTDTAFSKMIVRIEKELMIVGSTAFIFRLIVSPTANSSPMWASALNYADLIIPIFSFCYCGIGLLLISGQLSFKLSWKPMNSIINKMEFRIFHFIFCDFFQIQPSAFAFDEYVARVYEKYVFSIISIGVMHWMLLCLLVLLNWARIEMNLQYQSCHSDNSKCQKVNDVIIFTFAGAVLYFITAVLVYVSRNLEMKIMLKKDITSYRAYYQYLFALDEAHEMKAPQIVEKLNEEGLKEIVQKATLKAHKEKLDDDVLGSLMVACVTEIYVLCSRLAMRVYMTCASRRIVSIDEVMQRFGSWDENDVDGSFLSIRSRPSLLQQQQQQQLHQGGGRRRVNSAESLNPGEYYSLPSLLTDNRFTFTVAEERSRGGDEGESTNQVPGSAAPARARARTSSANFDPGRPAGRQSIGRGSGIGGVTGGGPRGSNAQLGPPRSSLNSSQKPGGVPETHRRRSIATLANSAASSAAKRLTFQTLVLEVKGDHIKDLFWLSKPDLYFQVVRFFIMLIALYIALWLVDFTSADVGSGRSALAILPGILSLINYIYVVKTAALVKAMHTLDFEATQQVLNQTDGSRALEKRIRDALRIKVGTEGDVRKGVYDLFCQIDYNFSGSIARQEFSLYLVRLGIVLNRKQWKETFRNIDTDSNETISFQEFFIFLYPEHRAAIHSERRRLLTISHRLENHTQPTTSSSILEFLAIRKRRSANAYTVEPTRTDSFTGDGDGGGGGGGVDEEKGVVAPIPDVVKEAGENKSIVYTVPTKRAISGFGRSLNLGLGLELGSTKDCSKESIGEVIEPANEQLPVTTLQQQPTEGRNRKPTRLNPRFSPASPPSAKIEVQMSFLASARSSSSSSSSNNGSSGNEEDCVVHPGEAPTSEVGPPEEQPPASSRPKVPPRTRISDRASGVANASRQRTQRLSDGDKIISS